MSQVFFINKDNTKISGIVISLMTIKNLVVLYDTLTGTTGMLSKNEKFTVEIKQKNKILKFQNLNLKFQTPIIECYHMWEQKVGWKSLKSFKILYVYLYIWYHHYFFYLVYLNNIPTVQIKNDRVCISLCMIFLEFLSFIFIYLDLIKI